MRDYEDMQAYIEISDAQIIFLQKYPHPWSFLGKRKSSFSLPGYMSSEQYTQISLRVAENCINANIRDNIKYPLFLTSANTSGHPESSTLEGARAYFPQIYGFDGGMCDSLPSDIFSIDEEGDLYYLRKNYSL